MIGDMAWHMSEWISIKDIIKKVAAKCPEGTPIPSKDLVRLQFTPKIRTRELRVSQTDDHNCGDLYKYFKSKAIAENENVMVFCCDDKAKVHVGEPEAPVSTKMRGRKVSHRCQQHPGS